MNKVDIMGIYSARIGDYIICNGEYAEVTEWKIHPAGTHFDSPIRDDWDAIQYMTRLGSRWRGFEPVDETGMPDPDL